jgi:uncharacterized protein
VNMYWLNEPPHWTFESEQLKLTTANASDFWRITHYGFTRDSGHVYGQIISGDFSLEVCFRADYTALYDQAGLMLRISESVWIKAGIEYTDGLQHLACVVTNNLSDWSVLPLEHPPEWLYLRCTRRDKAVLVQYSLDGSSWHMMRLCPFDSADVFVGMMACSPERSGLNAAFRGFRIGEPTGELHG